MKNAIEETNRLLNVSLQKEIANSGCTLLSILIRDEIIYCFNIGSSRAVLALKSNKNESKKE